MSCGGIFTGERLLAGDPLFAADMSRHLVAYQFAQQQVRGKNVLDAGCGDGYGTDMLAQTAARALGVDRSAETIDVAGRRCRRPNLTYRACDLDRLSGLGEQFDVVCNFQVIEHLVDPKPFLGQARQVLRPGGCLIVTTPNRLNTLVENPYHVHEYVAGELAELLGEFFAGGDARRVRQRARDGVRPRPWRAGWEDLAARPARVTARVSARAHRVGLPASGASGAAQDRRRWRECDDHACRFPHHRRLRRIARPARYLPGLKKR